MNKILEFLKTLVVPQKMAKYRYMLALLSIIIFVLIVYFLSVPISHHIKLSKDEMRLQYNYQALQEIEARLPGSPENELVLQKLSNLECAVDKGVLNCANLADNEVFDEEIVIEVNNITKKIRFVVDLKENAAAPVIDLDTYPYTENEEIYFVGFYPLGLYFQAHQKGINEVEEKIVHNDNELVYETRPYYNYSSFMPELNLKRDEAGARGLGGYIVGILLDADVAALNSQFLAYLFINIVLLPIFFIMLFWLMFRKNGKLVTFKEYYNIAAISIIAPMVLTFIILWIWGDYRFSLTYSIFGFLIYYIFSLYKINNAPDEV
ncbi:MAG: hypothetical protein WC006_00010 [Bacilli bacterium]